MDPNELQCSVAIQDAEREVAEPVVRGDLASRLDPSL